MVDGSQPRPARPPAGLGPRGRRLWRAVIADYDLSVVEKEILAELARTLDRIDLLEKQLAIGGPMVAGSRGQLVLNPAVAETRQLADLAGRLARSLALPAEVDETEAAARFGRAGAMARWYGRR